MNCVLVHGWMVTAKLWDDFAPRLEARTFAPTSLPDQAAVATTTLESLAERVLADIDDHGFDRFCIVGHSMGGQVAQLVAAAAKTRVQALALVNPVPLGGLPLPPDVATMFRQSGGNRAAQGQILDLACLELSPEAKNRLLDDAATIPAAWVARGLDLFAKGTDASKLDAIDCPTLVVATDDPFLPPPFLEETVVSKIRGAKLAVLKGPGHYPQIERPSELAGMLRTFFRGSIA